MVPSPLYRATRIGSAAILGAASVFHVVKTFSGDGSAARHVAFVVANGALAWLLVARPKWAFWPALVLTLQQMYSHGLDLAASFNGTTPLDKTAIAVCLFFPTLVTILYLERQEAAEQAVAQAPRVDEDR